MDIDITKIFEEKELKPSFHRIKIYEYLLNAEGHPTVDEIYQDLLKSIPTLSKTTVYNSMKAFVKKGMVNEITIQGTEMCYDAIQEPHGHFRCEKCNKIYDFPLEDHICFKQLLQGFEIDERHIHLKGICKKCKTLAGEAKDDALETTECKVKEAVMSMEKMK